MALLLENQLEVFSNPNLQELNDSASNEEDQGIGPNEENEESSSDEQDVVSAKKKTSKRRISSDSEESDDESNDESDRIDATKEVEITNEPIDASPVDADTEKSNEEEPATNQKECKSSRREKKSINLDELRQKYRNMEDDKQSNAGINLKEMFSDDSSDDDTNEIQKEDDAEDLNDEVSLENILPAEKKRKKIKRPKKSAVAEMESEQQRLIRDSSIKIAYHVPEAKSVKHFLQRVPDIKISKRNASQSAKERSQPTPPKSLLSKVFLSTPKLASATDFNDDPLQLEDSVDHSESDGFINKLKKHTNPSTPSVTTPTTENTSKQSIEPEIGLINFESVRTAKTPGSRLEALKGELKSKINEERKHQRLMIESQQQIDDEDFSAEEEGEETDGVSDDNDDDDDDILKSNIKVKTPEKLNLFGQTPKTPSQQTPLKGPAERDIDIMQATDDTQDIEVEKWNMVDARTQLERELSRDKFDERDKVDALAVIKTDAIPTTGLNPDGSSSALSNSVTSDDSGRPDLIETESSIHPWQPTRSSHVDNEDVSLSNQTNSLADESDDNGLQSFNETPLSTFGTGSSMSSSIPIQQQPQKRKPDPIIHDEDAQFTQILDTQGFLKPVAVSRQPLLKSKTSAASFQSISDALRMCNESSTEKSKPTGLMNNLHENSESQNIEDALQFCSGQFENSSNHLKKPLSLFSLPSNSATQNEEELLGLCSGKFSSSPAGSSAPDAAFCLPIDKEATQDDNVLLGLCSGKFEKSPQSKRSLFSLSTSTTQADDELLGLCSGKFPDSTQTQRKSCLDKCLPVDAESTQDEDELVALCSGIFPTATEFTSSKTAVAAEKEDSEDDIIFSVKRINKKTIDSQRDDMNIAIDNETIDGDDDDDDANSIATVAVDSDAEEIETNEAMVVSHVPNRLNRHDFVEEEAELSGSEAGSDEDDDLGSEFDEYEEDSEVEDLPSHEELKNQVNKAHLKSVLDEDKREIRRYQEMFFEDGDLHTDGQGRRRNFRWKHIDDMNFSSFGGADDSNDEADETEALNTSDHMAVQGKKRKERFERETYMQEKEPCSMPLDEDSQSILNLIKDTSHLSPPIELAEDSRSISSVSTKRAGSFLSRSKTALSRLSHATAQTVKAKRAAFVFQSVSPSKDHAQSNQGAHVPHRSNSSGPAIKRRCIDRSSSTPTTSKSIFSHLV